MGGSKYIKYDVFLVPLKIPTQCGSYMAAEAHYLKKASAVFF